MKSKGEKVNCLEARIEQTIDRAVDDWMNDPRINTRCNEHVAQAIVQEFGVTVETEPGHDPRECGCSSRAYPAESRIVGKWEQQ